MLALVLGRWWLVVYAPLDSRSLAASMGGQVSGRWAFDWTGVDLALRWVQHAMLGMEYWQQLCAAADNLCSVVGSCIADRASGLLKTCIAAPQMLPGWWPQQ
jgi:hypothetical protein